MEKGKCFFCGGEKCFFGGEEKQKRKRRKISGEGKRIFCKENENEEGKVDIRFKRKQYFCGGEEKNEKEKEENTWRRKFFGRSRKMREIFGEGKNIFC